MKTATDMAKELRAEAARFTKAADILDPPEREVARRKPGPKPGRRRARLKAVNSNGSSSSSAPTANAPTEHSPGTTREPAPVGTTDDGAA